MEDSNIDRLQFLKYTESHFGREKLKEESFLNAIQICDHACDEAHRLEVEIKDHIQLINGQQALQESRKSIELSNAQIRESKRGKSSRDLCTYKC